LFSFARRTDLLLLENLGFNIGSISDTAKADRASAVVSCVEQEVPDRIGDKRGISFFTSLPSFVAHFLAKQSQAGDTFF
jgi:hypothetical protein